MHPSRFSGVLYVGAETGRAMRTRRVAVLAKDVLWCSGDFHAGDAVHVVMRGNDGGQGVIAFGVLVSDEIPVGKIRSRTSASWRADPDEDRSVVIRESDVHLPWRH